MILTIKECFEVFKIFLNKISKYFWEVTFTVSLIIKILGEKIGLAKLFKLGYFNEILTILILISGCFLLFSLIEFCKDRINIVRLQKQKLILQSFKTLCDNHLFDNEISLMRALFSHGLQDFTFNDAKEIVLGDITQPNWVLGGAGRHELSDYNNKINSLESVLLSLKAKELITCKGNAKNKIPNFIWNELKKMERRDKAKELRYG